MIMIKLIILSTSVCIRAKCAGYGSHEERTSQGAVGMDGEKETDETLKRIMEIRESRQVIKGEE